MSSAGMSSARRLHWLTLLTAMLVCPSLSAQTPTYRLSVNTEEYPPFNYQIDGVIVGEATARLRRAFDETGIDARFQLFPWARAYTEARFRPDHCVYSTTRTPARELMFRWAGPLAINEWAALARTDTTFTPTRLSELVGLRVGSFREDAIGDYAESRGIRIIRAPSERVNVARLEAGLLDVIVTGRATAEAIAAERHVVLRHLFTFAYMPLYLACHPSVPHHVMMRLQHVLRATP
ncbi:MULTISPECIES: substrate-binding periplasmic protein [unclassified Halomonas]|uniref:substrate-binding periplasmic protein n=1 Tax=unclassified Halomonas TaxID=2609666 RepID=UPI0021E3DB9A|nr:MULTISPECIES: transporter substrate-binding domain-containing protein [unclassified Halomonas]UYG00478.1 transporter substrate-binding domain-containing protein [Halomonas sp. GD1P12]WNL38447.1 transporter substrate-binding domain-containing protein [Halomonas sp. PAMB 3232]WNL41747.1 transporter substrate-binding domain-containing protein [Halomonas sp. PAMB 3264]